MKNKLERKNLIEQYNQVKHEMGVYRLINSVTGRYFLCSTTDIKNIFNKFEFGKQTNTPGVFPRKIETEIKRDGFDSFSIEVLELLDVKPDMTEKDIKEELNLLEEIWREKLGSEKEY